MFHPSVIQAIDQISAQIFSGYLDEKMVDHLQETPDRWNRGVQEQRQVNKDTEQEEEP